MSERTLLSRRDRDSVFTVTIVFFDHLANAFGFTRRVEIPRGGCALSALQQRLADAVVGGREALGGSGVRSAVDRVMTGANDVWVRPGQEIAFFSLLPSSKL